MQTFSNMRRGGSYSQSLKNIALFITLFVYESLAGLLGFLPPLLGVFFLLLVHYDKEDDFWRFCIILSMLFVVEIFNDMPLGILLILFLVLRYVVFLYIRTFNAKRFLIILQIALVYFGLYLVFITFKSFGNPYFDINSLILVYYFVVETVLASFYEYSI
ncbi:hypothetical protein ACRE1S_03995 [Helicobacter himalayensis]|uniref:hypothetical protein n=1 Tax=Helicobacter himalayensis TaxID=1591088 RepID=UPI003D6E2F37